MRGVEPRVGQALIQGDGLPGQARNDGRSRQVTPSSHEREPNCLKR